MRKIISLLRTIYASIAKRGIFATIVLIPKVRYRLFNIKLDDDFDRKYNVETATILQAGELVTKSKNWKYSSAYEAIHSSFSLSELLSSFQIDFSEYVFIDLGSGKGRVILMASMLPFKEIIGIEFSESLNIIAKGNVDKFPKDMQLCRNISLYSIDAVEYRFPNEKYILFMFNPFDKPIMEKVINNLSQQFYRHPNNIIIIYVSPATDLFDKMNFLKRKIVNYEFPLYEYSLYEVIPGFL